MCDFSLMHVASRAAKVGDRLTTTVFDNSTTRGLSSKEDTNVAVCVLPGTEMAFDDIVVALGSGGFFDRREIETRHKVAVFRQVDKDKLHMHHDALEFPDGTHVLINDLKIGQTCTVLQLPAAPKTEAEETEQKRLAVTA